MKLKDNRIGDVIEDEDQHELVLFQLHHTGVQFSHSAVKDNLRELAKVGLIEKKRSVKNGANMIFVKVSETSIIGQFSDCNRAENKPYKGLKTAYTSVRKSTPSYSNNKKKEIPNYEYREGDSL